MKRIVIVGLGPGAEEQLTKAAIEALERCQDIYLRTKQHPAVPYLDKRGISYKSFDYAYERADSIDEAHSCVVASLVEKAREAEIVYAVPGHPLVAEKTVHMLLAACRGEGIEAIVLPAMSFLDVLLPVVGADLADGFKLLDALKLEEQRPDTGLANIVVNVNDSFVAAELKQKLMDYYADEKMIYVIRAAGIPDEENIVCTPLCRLDRIGRIDCLTSIYIPKTEPHQKKYFDMNNLAEIMGRLRNKDGCPWDIKQTHESLKPYLIEESYEVLEAIDLKEDGLLLEELGDLLLQVVFHSQIARERQAFTLEEVIHGLADKLVFRHPHVFSDYRAKDCKEAFESWESKKKEEKQLESTAEAMELIPKHLPALMKAYKLQKKAAAVGFDWDKAEDVLSKVQEELLELQEAVEAGCRQEMHSEAGDLVFAVVNLLRFYDIEPEEALRGACQKFLDRFRYVEQAAKASGKELKDMTLAEMDVFWEQAKGK